MLNICLCASLPFVYLLWSSVFKSLPVFHWAVCLVAEFGILYIPDFVYHQICVLHTVFSQLMACIFILVTVAFEEVFSFDEAHLIMAFVYGSWCWCRS